MKKRISLSLRQLLFTAFLFLLFSGLTLAVFSFGQNEKRFTNITSRLFREEMQANTLNMHYTIANPASFGIYSYTPTLPAYQDSSTEQNHAALDHTLSALNGIHTEKLSQEDAFLCTLLTRYLETSRTLSGFSYYGEPLSPSSGMQSQLPILLSEYTFRSRRDVEDYLALLGQTGSYFSSLLSYSLEKAAAGLPTPSSFYKTVREQCGRILKEEDLDAGTHFLQTSFQERLLPLLQQNILTSKEAASFVQQNDTLLKTVLLPAYQALQEGLAPLEEKGSPVQGLCRYPEGQKYYEALLRAETGSYRSVPEVQRLLTSQFTAEYEALREIFTRHPEAATLYKADSTAFPLTSPSQMLSDLQLRMQPDFPALSNASLSVSIKPVSENMQKNTAPAFYLTVPLDASDSHVIYINTEKTPDGLELYTTLAHEGYPGHLYQTAYKNQYFQETDARPVKELLWYGGYTEGWALYVEFRSYAYAAALLRENGLEQEALCTEIEQHNRSLQLCLYSLLDTMIHYEDASHSQIAKMLEGFGITDSSSIRAIYSYIAGEPCNYLKYYLGYLEILSLKEEARRQWGSDYSDFRFHQFFLENGPADFLSLKEQLLQ